MNFYEELKNQYNNNNKLYIAVCYCEETTLTFLKSDIIQVVHCHCKGCRKAHGTALFTVCRIKNDPKWNGV